jgi:hypothetical protein
MFSNNTELGIMEQAYMKLKSQSMSVAKQARLEWVLGTGKFVDEFVPCQIQIYNRRKHPPRDRSHILTDKRRKKNCKWR